MNRKQLGILLVLLVALGGAGLVLFKRQNASWSDAKPGIGKKLLGDFPVNDVSRIVIKEGTNTLNLVKQDDRWRVKERGDYPANYSDISGFLLKARDLKVVQTETVGPSQLPKLQLAPARQGAGSAVTVEFKGQGDKLINTVLLGKKHLKKSNRPSQFGEGDEGWPDGRYVKLGDSAEVAVISDSLDNIEPKPAQWLDKDFVHVEKARSVEVVFPSATNSWKLTRETESGEWKLADAKPGEELDSSKIASVSSPLSSPGFTDILLSPKPEQTGLDKPAVVTIGTFDEFTYVVKIGQKTNDDFPLTVAVTAQIANERPAGKDEKPENKAKLDKEFSERRQKLEDKLKQEQNLEKWTYLVASWTIDPLLKERSQFLTEKKEEPKAGGNSATNAIEKVDEPRWENQTPPTVTPKE
jgi:hypothetical protein